MEAKSFNEINESMKNEVITRQNKLTDFNDGSVISGLVESVSRQIGMLYIRARVGFNSYLKNLPYSIFDFQKKEGVKASGSVVFSRAEPIEYDTSISVGTIVSAGGQKFFTTQSGNVPSGSVFSNEIGVVAENIGVDYNVPIGAINAVDSVLPSDIVSVKNNQKIFGGANAENDVEYLTRFQEFTLGLQATNYYGLRTAALNLLEVRSVSIIEHFPPINNRWNVSVYIDDGTGNCPPVLIEKVENVINGDNTASNPGKRAPGVNVKVLAPTIVPIETQITLYVKNVDNAVAISETKNNVTEYINSLLVGQNVILTSIILILRRLSYVDDVKIHKPLDNYDSSD